jgi:putative DNA primase/helicase
MMFAISTALAAPLLAITGAQSFAFCLYGRTRSGKTIATLGASSVIGIGRRQDLINWNISDARLEQRLSEFNDLLFPIDDLANMKGKTGEKYLRIRETAYRVSQGWAMGRHSLFTKGEGGHSGWRSIMLTSFEKSIRDLAIAAKVERQHGERLRLIDVPAVFDGLNHIFDRGSAPPQESKTWRDATFANVVADCGANHGVALEYYLNRIISADFDVREMAEHAMASFVEHVVHSEDDVVARDVAAKFGLVYAGGMLGIRSELCPGKRTNSLMPSRNATEVREIFYPMKGYRCGEVSTHFVQVFES